MLRHGCVGKSLYGRESGFIAARSIVKWKSSRSAVPLGVCGGCHSRRRSLPISLSRSVASVLLCSGGAVMEVSARVDASWDLDGLESIREDISAGEFLGDRDSATDGIVRDEYIRFLNAQGGFPPRIAGDPREARVFSLPPIPMHPGLTPPRRPRTWINHRSSRCSFLRLIEDPGRVPIIFGSLIRRIHFSLTGVSRSPNV